MGRVAIAKKPVAFDKWVLEEVTICDVPVQQPAAAVIMKAMKAAEAESDKDDDEDDEKHVAKRIKLTSVEGGHQHIIDDDAYQNDGGHTSYESDPGAEYGHSHAWVRNTDGSLTIAVNEGHTHSILEEKTLTVLMREDVVKRAFDPDERKRLAEAGVARKDGSYAIVTKADLRDAIREHGDTKAGAEVAKHITSRAVALELGAMLPAEGELALSKSGAEGAQDADPDPKEGSMPISNPKGATPSDADTKIADLEKRLVAATALAAMTDVEKAFMASLDETGQEAFLKADAESRKRDLSQAEELAKAQDPVVFTAKDGTEFRKSDDVRLVQMAKDRDHDREIAKAERETREGLEFEKRAETEFAALPGENVAKVALLRVVSTIEKAEDRDAVLAILKAQNAEMAKALTRIGTTVAAEGDSEKELNKMATELAEKKGVSFEKAFSDVLDTEVGRKLYAEHEAERMARNVGAPTR
jgi:hypothetical protein